MSKEQLCDCKSLPEQLYVDLFRFAFALVGSGDDACELTRQTCSDFAQIRLGMEDPVEWKKWLFRTLYRKFMLRSGRGKCCVVPESRELESGFSAEAWRLPEQQEMLEALLCLEESQRAVLSLFYLGQCPRKEIPEMLDIPIGSVLSYLCRAKDTLHARLHGVQKKVG